VTSLKTSCAAWCFVMLAAASVPDERCKEDLLEGGTKEVCVSPRPS
jgi:hypothetical protein